MAIEEALAILDDWDGKDKGSRINAHAVIDFATFVADSEAIRNHDMKMRLVPYLTSLGIDLDTVPRLWTRSQSDLHSSKRIKMDEGPDVRDLVMDKLLNSRTVSEMRKESPYLDDGDDKTIVESVASRQRSQSLGSYEDDEEFEQEDDLRADQASPDSQAGYASAFTDGSDGEWHEFDFELPLSSQIHDRSHTNDKEKNVLELLLEGHHETALHRLNERIDEELDEAKGKALFARRDPDSINHLPTHSKLALAETLAALTEHSLLELDRNARTRHVGLVEMHYAPEEVQRLDVISVTKRPDNAHAKLGDILHVPFQKSEQRALKRGLNHEKRGSVNWETVAQSVAGRDAFGCKMYYNRPSKPSGKDIIYLDSERLDIENNAHTVTELVETTKLHFHDDPGAKLDHVPYRCVQSFNQASGDIIELQMRKSHLGTQVAVGACSNWNLQYNRSGNILLHSVDQDQTKELVGHVVPIDETKTNGDLVYTPYRNMPLQFDHIFTHAPADLFYPAALDIRFVGETQIASAASEGAIAIWSGTGELERLLIGARKYNASGRGIIYECEYYTNRITEHVRPADVGRPKQGDPQLRDEVAHIYRIVKHPTERSIIASCAQDGTLWLWDINGDTRPEVIFAPFPETSRSSEPKTKRRGYFSYRNGGRLIGSHKHYCCVDAVFGRGKLSDRIYAAYSVDFSGEANFGHVQAFDLSKMAPIASFKLAEGVDACALDIADSGSYMLLGSEGITDGNLRMLDPRTLEVTASIHNKQYDVNLVSISPCEMFFATGGVDGRSFMYDRRFLQRPLFVFKHAPAVALAKKDSGILSGHWGPNSKYWYTGGSDGLVRIWDPLFKMDPEGLYGTLAPGDGTGVLSLSLVEEWTPNGPVTDDSMICCGTESGTVALFTKHVQ